MSFVTNEDIKTALVAKIKSMSEVTSLLASAAEVRESQWQGTEFAYPNVRIRVVDNHPLGSTGCYHTITVGFQVNSEKDSSQEAEHISGIIGETLNDAPFQTNDLTFILRITNLVPALRVDPKTWRSEALFTGIVS